VSRCWGIVQDNLVNGKPQLNGSPMCKCQFTDWSVKNDGNHVPGYTMINSPLNGLTGLTDNSGAPVYTTTVPAVKSMNTFNQWFNDSSASSPANMHFVSTIELAASGNSYRFLSNPDSVLGGFFPLDKSPAPTEMGNTAAGEPLVCNLWPYWYSSASFGAGAGCKGDQYLFPPSIPANLLSMSMCTGTNDPGCITGTWVTGVQGKWHNYWFTEEVHYYFVFPPGGIQVQVAANDDKYLFVNGKLILDLGGTHRLIPGKVSIDGTGTATVIEGGYLDSAGNILPCPSNDPMDPDLKVCGVRAVLEDDCRSRSMDLGLVVGKTYELALFGADRGGPTESNLQITTTGFSKTMSTCVRTP
jgi:fibro-slime domain-containing protein